MRSQVIPGSIAVSGKNTVATIIPASSSRLGIQNRDVLKEQQRGSLNIRKAAIVTDKHWRTWRRDFGEVGRN